MSVFYFSYTSEDDPSQDIIYELSSTTNVSVRENATVTRFAVEDGSNVADNFNIDNRQISFSGVITDIRVFGQPENRRRSVEDWIDQIRQLRKDKKLLTVSVHSLQSIPNCVITQFDIDRDVSHGLTGWDCNLGFTEITVSDRARLVEVKLPKPEVKDDVASKSSSSDSSTKEVALSNSLYVKATDLLP